MYRGNNNLTDTEKEKAITQLEEILSLLPISNTEHTDWDLSPSIDYSGKGPLGSKNTYTTTKELPFFYIPESLGPLQSLPQAIKDISTNIALNTQSNTGDIYQQMHNQQQSAEEIYLSKHPEEAYNYTPPKTTVATTNNYKLDNLHSSTNSKKQSVNDSKILTENLVPPLKTKIVANNVGTGKSPVLVHSSKKANTIHSSSVSGNTLPLKTRTRYIIYPPVISQYLPYKPTKTAEPFKIQRMDKFATINGDKSYDFENFNSLLYSAGMNTNV